MPDELGRVHGAARALLVVRTDHARIGRPVAASADGDGLGDAGALQPLAEAAVVDAPLGEHLPERAADADAARRRRVARADVFELEAVLLARLAALGDAERGVNAPLDGAPALLAPVLLEGVSRGAEVRRQEVVAEVDEARFGRVADFGGHGVAEFPPERLELPEEGAQVVAPGVPAARLAAAARVLELPLVLAAAARHHAAVKGVRVDDVFDVAASHQDA